MKRFFALFLVVVMMLTMVACGAKEAPAETKAPETQAAAPAETEAAAEEPAAEPVTIHTIHYMVEG